MIINILADDLPPEEIRIRRPHYADGTPRPAAAWSGTLAFLTRKRTAPDGKRLSLRYPLVEIVTAAFFAYIAANYPSSGLTIFLMANVAILLLITVIDLEHKMILFIIMIPAYLYALIGAALVNTEISSRVTFRDYAIGGLLGFGLFTLMYLGGMLFNSVVSNARSEEVTEVAFGYGDVLLATLSGFMLGWQALIFAVFIAVFAGAAGALIYLVAHLLLKGRYDAFTALPYGQYIVFGTLIMMLWRDPVAHIVAGRLALNCILLKYR